MKWYYMHTIDGKPAIFDGKAEFKQIAYAQRITANDLRSSLQQIRRDQKISKDNRVARGWDYGRYGYVRVQLPLTPNRGHAAGK